MSDAQRTIDDYLHTPDFHPGDTGMWWYFEAHKELCQEVYRLREELAKFQELSFKTMQQYVDEMQRAEIVGQELARLKEKMERHHEHKENAEKRAETAEARINELKDIIRIAAPLAWVLENDNDAAYSWEKKAYKLLKGGDAS